MIYTGENEITVMLGDMEIPAIYAGDLLIYPTDFGTVTGITIEDLVWVTDIPKTGGTATADNCSFKVMAHYDSGKSRNVKSRSTVEGSLVVPATTAETREYVGVLTLTASYEGFTATDSVDAYQNPDFESQPLTFEILSDGVVKWFYRSSSSGARTIEYKLNNGSWTSITSTSAGVSIPVVAGDTVQFRGDNVKYGDSLNSNVGSQFDTTCRYNVYGNIMSLINSTDFATLTNFQAGSAAHFLKLFADNAYLVSAQNLKLPALRLGQLTYAFMFQGCTSLTTAPESVGTSETVFDFTGTYNYTCREMFRGCTNLITAPALPALSLGQTCYESMFRDCTSLTTAPELPATTLAGYCYNEMFRNCSSLNYVKCLATNISASYCTAGWLNGVSASGTFVKNPNMSGWSTGNSGIPSGWTIIDAT